MRLFCIVLVVVVTLFAIAEPASVSVGSRLATSDFASVRSLISNRNDAHDKRLLRTDAKEDESDEERAITIPGLPRINEWFTTFVSKIRTSFTQRRQIRGWMKEEKTPDDVFKLLKLDEGTDTLMANPKLKTWSVFMTTYNRKNLKNMVTMLGVFTKTYGDEAVAKMLELARQGSTKKLANTLQTEQLWGWARNGLSTDHVFQVLRVGEGSIDKLLANRALNVWFYYFNLKNRYSADREVNLIKKLLTAYDDIPLAKAIEAATKVKSTEFMGKELQKSQFKKWLADGTNPPTVFEKLKMDKGGDMNEDIYNGYRLFYKENHQMW